MSQCGDMDFLLERTLDIVAFPVQRHSFCVRPNVVDSPGANVRQITILGSDPIANSA
jgi:hypothetical protein